jgi:phosphatidate cytidylyltransferase
MAAWPTPRGEPRHDAPSISRARPRTLHSVLGAALNLSGTWARVLTAAVLIPVVVVIVLWGTTPLVAALAALVLLLALLEFFALGERIGLRGYRFWTALCSLGLLLLQLAATAPSDLFPGDVRGRVLGPPGAEVQYLAHERMLLLLVLFAVGCAVIILFGRRPLSEALPEVSISAGALLLLTLPFSYLVRIHGLARQGRLLLLFTLVLVWVGDTAAYFVGRNLGRVLLAPHLSPKKTWEGAIANLAGSLLVAWAFSQWITSYSLEQLLGAAAVANLAGQIGDLTESAYKRSAGVKDSGTLLPGHGGVLDRIDALIFAVPAVWWYLWISTPRSRF